MYGHKHALVNPNIFIRTGYTTVITDVNIPRTAYMYNTGSNYVKHIMVTCNRDLMQMRSFSFVSRF